VSGETTLPVPPGEHRVLVSRGYEYELIDQTVSVQAGATSDIDALVEHSVDTSGVLCADFHIHSHFSADSSDPVLRKVKSALADGLDIPVSSEHEWIVDFQPVIESLGASDWAYGVPSEELTTFTWGHFGVVPLEIRPDDVNNGAIDWVGKEPTEVFSMVRAREEKPFLIVNHPLSSGFGGYFTIANFDTKKKRMTIFDAPGHKNYVPNMIMGAALADYGALVISAKKGEFEAGFEADGQTREHVQLAKSLGIYKLVVVVNKMDEPSVKWSKDRYNDIIASLRPFLT
jgi:hypothetical protein